MNGVYVKVMMDNGVTNKFMASREVAKLRLKLEENTSRIKVVNNKA